MWATLGDTIKPILNEMLQNLVPIVTTITDWIKENPKLAGTILIVATALTGIVTVLAGLALALPSIIAGVKLLGAVVGALTSPIGLVILAVTAFALAYKTNFLGIRDITNSVMSWIGEKISAVWQWITEMWDTHGAGIMESARNLWTTVQEVWSIALGAITEKVSVALAWISEFWKTNKDLIIGIITGMWETVKMIFTLAFDAIMIAVRL